MRVLTFALVAPFASFGSIAVGEQRPSWDRPGRSAIIGLVGACLGVDREDDEGQDALNGYRIAVLCHSPGELLTDYHTAQMPRTPKGRPFRTRAEELNAADQYTVLSWREYRVGAWHLGALWPRADARWSLEQIAAAMRRPVFPPYLGRRCCPLGLPLAPMIIDAVDAPAALMERHRTGPEATFRVHPTDRRTLRDDLARPVAETTITLDADTVAVGDPRHRRTESRRDQPLSRRRWQHGLRNEAILGGVS